MDETDIRIAADSKEQQMKEERRNVIERGFLLLIGLGFAGLSSITLAQSLLFSGFSAAFALLFAVYAVR